MKAVENLTHPFETALKALFLLCFCSIKMDNLSGKRAMIQILRLCFTIVATFLPFFFKKKEYI